MEDLLNMSNANTEKAAVLYETKLHWISMVFPILLMIVGSVGLPFMILALLDGGGGIVTILSVGLSFLFLKGLYSFLLKRSMRVEVTENQLTLLSGIFSKNISDISLNKLEGLQLHQSFLGKQLNFGTLYISTGGESQSYKIQHPMELREVVMGQIMKLRD